MAKTVAFAVALPTTAILAGLRHQVGLLAIFVTLVMKDIELQGRFPWRTKDTTPAPNAGAGGKRIVWIDYAKAVGIALVVFAHLPSPLVPFIFQFHMPLFFVLSGFLYKPIGARRELGRSFRCLVVPYLVYNAGLLALTALFGSFRASMVAGVLLGNQASLPGNYFALWFVVSLFLMRMAVSGLHSGRAMAAASLLSVLAFAAVRGSGFVSPSCDYFQLGSSLLCLPFFVFGIAIRRLSLERLAVWLGAGRTVAFAVASGGLLLWAGMANGDVDVFRLSAGKSLAAFYVVSASLSYLFVLACKALSTKENMVVRTLSQGTLPILAVHQTMILAMGRFVEFHALTSVAATLLILLLCYPLVKVGERFFPLLLLGKRNVG